MNENDTPRKRCASTIRRDYQLTQKELDTIPCVETRNPYYRNAAPMRLFEISDVEEYVNWKREYFSDENKALRKDEARQRRHAIARTYTADADAKKKKREHMHENYTEQLPLDNDVLSKIIETLADAVEAFGVNGPTVVAQNLVRAALVCKQFSRAYQAGMARLGSVMVTRAVKSPPLVVRDNASPHNRVTHDPMSLNMTVLKEICRDLGGCRLTGDKREVVGHLLKRLRLVRLGPDGEISETFPTCAPLSTVWAVCLERDRAAYETYYAPAASNFKRAFSYLVGETLHFCYHRSRSLAVNEYGVSSQRDLMKAVDEKRRKCSEEARLQVQAAIERKKAKATERSSSDRGCQSCVQPFAATCTVAMCKTCCVARTDGIDCSRHNVYFPTGLDR